MYMGPPPPIIPVPTLPILYDDDDAEKLAKDTQHLLTKLAPHATDRAEFGSYLESRLLLAAIDPDTGDSFVHRAAVAGNLAALEAIPFAFGSNWTAQPGPRRMYWVLMTHRNHAGETALHAAAGAGNLSALKGVYRAYHAWDMDGIDNELVEGEEPPENWDWLDIRDDSSLPVLDFVCAKNHLGYDAAEQARAAGHEKLADWLEDLVRRLDWEDGRHDAEYMRKAREEALDIYWFDESEAVPAAE